MSDEQNLRIRYDQVTYESYAFAFTHPSRLAAMARLSGVATADPRGARVLELGCAAGGNLIPMAIHLPDATFLGIDLAAAEIARGRELANTLGLTNVDLRALDILAFDPNLGEFDYIVAHGMYSWVPASVRDKMLGICAQHLTPNGVAFFGYNVFPGRYPLTILREQMLLEARGAADVAQQISIARDVGRSLARILEPQNSPFAATLKAELKQLELVPDWYLSHDALAPVNEPVYFHRFVEHATSHGLQFVGEVLPHLAGSQNLSPDQWQTIRSFTSNEIVQEQIADVIGAQPFRRTMLCRAGLKLDRTGAATRLRDLHVSGLNKQAPDPLADALLSRINSAWPESIPVAQLIGDERVAPMLIEMINTGLIEIDAIPPPCRRAISDRPLATTLARMQAFGGGRITSLRHHQGDIVPAQRFILARLDGQHTRQQLLHEFRSHPDAGDSPEKTLDYSLRALSALGFLLG